MADLARYTRQSILGEIGEEGQRRLLASTAAKDSAPIDAHLVAQLLNDEGIAVRAGGHCAYPLAQRLDISGTVRASFYVYNTVAEVDRFLLALQEIVSHKLL